jgi:heterodisulfide reductase subunit C
MVPSRPTFELVPPVSEVLLYVVFAPFAAAFCFGVYRRLSGLHLGNLLRALPGGWLAALARLGWAGLLQRRVASRARGWPHLAIFYGFLTLLLGTTIVAVDWDLLRPFGVRLLVGTRYLYLEAVLDALGVVFVLGLLAALFWRLARLRATGVDQRRMQWQFVALIAALLYMGLTGFFLEALRLIVRPVPWAGWSFVGNVITGLLMGMGQSTARTVYVGLWWSHAVVAFALIAALPYTAFLHSLAAPLNLLVHPGRPKVALDAPFDLREIEATGNFDVKPGASTLADLTAEQRLAAFACTNCGRCDSVCPAFISGTALSPRRLTQSLREQLLARSNDVDLLESQVVQAAALWACTTCGACVEACPVFIRPVDFVVPFRRELVSRQRIDKRQTELLANLGRSFNPYGLPAANRARLANELDTLT